MAGDVMSGKRPVPTSTDDIVSMGKEAIMDDINSGDVFKDSGIGLLKQGAGLFSGNGKGKVPKGVKPKSGLSLQAPDIAGLHGLKLPKGAKPPKGGKPTKLGKTPKGGKTTKLGKPSKVGKPNKVGRLPKVSGNKKGGKPSMKGGKPRSKPTRGRKH